MPFLKPRRFVGFPMRRQNENTSPSFTSVPFTRRAASERFTAFPFCSSVSSLLKFLKIGEEWEAATYGNLIFNCSRESFVCFAKRERFNTQYARRIRRKTSIPHKRRNFERRLCGIKRYRMLSIIKKSRRVDYSIRVENGIFYAVYVNGLAVKFY